MGLQLLGDEGLVVTNRMWEGETLDRDEITRRIPLLKPDHPYDSGVWDPHAGSLRSGRALEALAAQTPITRATVTALEANGTVHAGQRYEAEAVLVTAGLGTQPLIEPLGLDLELTTEPHTRFTYPGTGACLISEDCYALPEGDTYAIGMHDPAARPDMFDLGEPIDRIECVSLFAPWLDHGDGFTILQAGKVIALGASNAMKFAPLLGAQLAERVLAA